MVFIRTVWAAACFGGPDRLLGYLRSKARNWRKLTGYQRRKAAKVAYYLVGENEKFPYTRRPKLKTLLKVFVKMMWQWKKLKLRIRDAIDDIFDRIEEEGIW